LAFAAKTDLEEFIMSTLQSRPLPIESTSQGPLTSEELRKLDAYWRAANYLSVGQIYLYANPLLREPLELKHIKPRLLGHWGTTPGLNFIYVHLNRLIKTFTDFCCRNAVVFHIPPAFRIPD